MDSVVGRNVLNSSLRYNMNVDRISKKEFGPHNINRYAVVVIVGDLTCNG